MTINQSNDIPPERWVALGAAVVGVFVTTWKVIRGVWEQHRKDRMLIDPTVAALLNQIRDIEKRETKALRDIIDSLNSEKAETAEIITDLRRQIADRDETIEALEAHIAALEARALPGTIRRNDIPAKSEPDTAARRNGFGMEER